MAKDQLLFPDFDTDDHVVDSLTYSLPRGVNAVTSTTIPQSTNVINTFCECGVDSAGEGGDHSDYCPKGKV